MLTKNKRQLKRVQLQLRQLIGASAPLLQFGKDIDTGKAAVRTRPSA